MFQSQTGSQALSDGYGAVPRPDAQGVSIPNGKPGPLRPSRRATTSRGSGCFNPKREARPSQTAAVSMVGEEMTEVSIPNGKPGPLRPLAQDIETYARGTSFNPKREARPSQTLKNATNVS